MIGTFVASAAGAALAPFEWRRLARRHPGLTLESALGRAKHLLALIPAALALLAIQLAVVTHPHLLWAAPVWLELHWSDVTLGGVGACLAFVSGLTAYGALVTRHSLRAGVPVFMAVVLGIVLFIDWNYSAPVWADLRDSRKDGVVLQSSGMSCAAAAAANLVRAYGIERSERQMAELLGTTALGTSPSQVIVGLRELGLSCRKRKRSIGELETMPVPAMLFLPPRAGPAGHAVVLVGAAGGGVSLIDPVVGRVKLTRAALAARWDGHAVECDRSAANKPGASVAPPATATATAASTSQPASSAEAPRGLRDGDLVFQESLSGQSAMVAALTRSRWTHMGVVFVEPAGPMVLEAVSPVTITPLDAWIARGRDRRYEVKRLRDADQVLTAAAIARMRELSRGWLGKPYDAQFRWSDDAFYCSELAYKLYERGAGVTLGAIERASDMNLDDERVKRALRSRFRPGEFDPREIVVTPQSMYADARLVAIR